MYKYKIILALFMTVLISTAAYSQLNLENHPIKNISGKVISTDSVGNIISILTGDQKQMEFFVPDKASITQETHNIGLMDIGKSDSVNIQYYLASSKCFVVSIVDNESVVNE
jgi:hypothetical protein